MRIPSNIGSLSATLLLPPRHAPTLYKTIFPAICLALASGGISPAMANTVARIGILNPAISLKAGQSATLSGKYANINAADLVWVVTEGEPGGSVQAGPANKGIQTATYRAPATPGTWHVRFYDRAKLRLSATAIMTVLPADPDQGELPHVFTDFFKWQGNHASTINKTNSSGTVEHVGSTVWWNEDAWDIVGDSGYLSVAYDDFGPPIGKETGFHFDIHKAASSDPTNSEEDNNVLIIGGNGSPGEAVMRLDEQGVLGARLRNPLLLSASRAATVDFYAPRFVTSGHWWEVAITPAGSVVGGIDTSVPNQIGRRPFEDGLNVVVIGHDDVPCLVGWHIRYDVSKTVNGVETLLEETHDTIEEFTVTDPSEIERLYHWRIEFRPESVKLYADFAGNGTLQLQRHVDVLIPWPEVHLHLLGVAYQADHHPQDAACYQGKVRELNWRNVSASPVKFARTSIAPRNGVTTNVQRQTGWMGYDLRDIQRYGPDVNGNPQANSLPYDIYGAMAFGSIDLSWAGAPPPVRQKNLTVDLGADQAGAPLAQLVYDIKGTGSANLTVNGTRLGPMPDMGSVRFFAAQALEGDNNLGQYTHRAITIPPGMLKAGNNTLTVDLQGDVVFDRLHLEFGHTH